MTNCDDELRLLREELRRRERDALRAELTRREALHDFSKWLPLYLPHLKWHWPHLRLFQSQLQRVTEREINRLAFVVPPQHGKTFGVTIPYPAWRMLREPGLRVGVGSHTQDYADGISRQVRKAVLGAGGVIGDVNKIHEWSLTNGSTFIAKGAGSAIAGKSIDLFMMDDVFGTREDADSQATQEKIYHWYMDDVTPRLQKHAALVLCNTRWNSGDLFGRIKDAEESGEWVIWRIPAVSESQEDRDAVNATYGLPAGMPDPIGRTEPGLALCEDRYDLKRLLQNKRIEGVGFESLYQGNPVPRGGTFFERKWFVSVDAVPPDSRLVRYWDLAASRKDSACYTSGVLMAKHGEGEATRYYVVDVVRGRWMPAERNEVMLQTARADATRPGFQRTYFEAPVFDKDRAAMRGIMAKLSGYPVGPDNVSGSGSKELRAEPLAGAAKAGLVSLVDGGSWKGAYLTEMEGFPRGQWKDQVDSSSGCYNKLSIAPVTVSFVG